MSNHIRGGNVRQSLPDRTQEAIMHKAIATPATPLNGVVDSLETWLHRERDRRVGSTSNVVSVDGVEAARVCT